MQDKKILLINGENKSILTEREFRGINFEFPPIKVAEQENLIVFKVVSKIESLRFKKVRKVRDLGKVIYISPIIDNGDLRVKCKKIDVLSEKGYQVKVIIRSRRKISYKKHSREDITDGQARVSEHIREYFENRIQMLNNKTEFVIKSLR